MNIGRFSVKNPVLINLLMIILLVLGVFSIFRLPREQFAEVPFFWANIIVPYPGAGAEAIEQSVTIRIEKEFQDISKLKQISSVTGEGLSSVRIQFDDGISAEEFARLFQEVQTRFNRVDLPDGTLTPVISDFSSADFLPVIEVILFGDAEFAVLQESAEILKSRIENVFQVSGAELVGGRERLIAVELDQGRMETLKVSLDDAVRAIRGRSAQVPGGTLESGSREFLLRTVGELATPADFEQIVIRAPSSGGTGAVTIGQVASVTERFDDRGVVSRYNGKRAISLRVTKVTRGDAGGIVERVERIVAEFENEKPPGIQTSLFNDSTVQIRSSISVLVNNAVFGFLLLILILYLFIGLRNALITALGIPVTFAITFIVLEAMGETLNSNTLFALVLVLGMIVDHAIVIIENSYRLTQEGYSRVDAAILGTNQVVVPIIAATLTTVAAFLPLMLLPGIIGRFLRVIPLTVAIALIASTFESIVFLPVHFAEWSGGSRRKRKKPPETPRISHFDRFRNVFMKLAGKIYDRKRRSVAVIFLLFAGSFALLPFIRQDLFSAEDFSVFYIDIEMPPGTPIDRTAELVREFESRIIPLIGKGDIKAVNSSVGFRSGSSSAVRKSSTAQISVDLYETSEGRTRPIIHIIQDVQDLTSHISGADSIFFRKAQTGPPTDPPVSFRFFGDSYRELSAVSGAVMAQLAEYPELYNIQDNLDPGSPEIRILVREADASRYGLSAFGVGTFIRGVFDGIPTATLFRDNREIPVVVTVQGISGGRFGDRGIERLTQLRIPTPDGRQIPFSSVAEIREESSIAAINRLEGRREVTVTSEAFSTDNVREINRQIRAFYDNELAVRYPSVTLRVGGEFAELANLLTQIARIFLAAIFVMYIILGTQFNSYTQPILILFSVPFSFVGIIFYLILSGTPFSTTVLYAGVALAGIAVNDSIVLIDFVNSLRAAGESIRDSVLKAVSMRMRPIILTSATTIAGLLPTGLGLGGKSVVWGPMANTIIFGLIFSTLTALLIIPCLYGIQAEGKARKLAKRQARAD